MNWLAAQETEPREEAMSPICVELTGTLQADGTLVLDRNPALPPGRVRVVLQSAPEAPPGEDWWRYMLRTRAELEAAGHRFLNEEEMNAHVEWLREGDPIDDLLRQ